MSDLREALRDLLEQVDSFEDITLTRDLDPQESEENWNDVYRKAKQALAQPQGKVLVDEVMSVHGTGEGYLTKDDRGIEVDLTGKANEGDTVRVVVDKKEELQ